MRTVLWTAFLVVAVQGMASASTALASPTAERAPVAAAETTDTPDTTTRLEADASRMQPSLRVEAERKTARSEPQVLSKNFPSPKPVQIYWFFGGR